MRAFSWGLFVTLCLSAGSALAVPTWTVNSLNSIGCTASTTNFTTTVAGYTGGGERFRTQVDSGGLRYMDEDAGTPVGNQQYSWSLYASTSGGPTSGTWPIPPGQQVTVNFMFINGAGGPIVYWRQIVLSKCDGGQIVSDQVYLDSSSASCVGLGDVPSGASYCPSVQFLKNRAITLGCTATTYCPNDAVTRAQMALFMNRLATSLEPVFVSASQSANTGSQFRRGRLPNRLVHRRERPARRDGNGDALPQRRHCAAGYRADRLQHRRRDDVAGVFAFLYACHQRRQRLRHPVAGRRTHAVHRGAVGEIRDQDGRIRTAPTVADAGCSITVRIDNHNGTSFPYDAATQPGPSTGAANTGVPSDLRLPMSTPAPSARSNNP